MDEAAAIAAAIVLGNTDIKKSLYQSSPKRPLISASSAAIASAAWRPEADTVIVHPGEAASIMRPMIEVPGTL